MESCSLSYQQIVKAAEEFLHKGEISPISGKKIAEHLEYLMNEGSVDKHPREVVYTYLSRAANHDSESRIVSGGPHGGYSLEPLSDVTTSIDVDPESSLQTKSQSGGGPLEKHLYPLLKLWLETSDYIAADVSMLKAGGHWGNPDLLGVSRAEMLGASEIELVSIEAKLSELGWERYIFEAVSHKRFVNRAWFCYRTEIPYPPLPKNMAYYAERYRVGILQVYLTDAELENAARGEKASAEYLQSAGTS